MPPVAAPPCGVRRFFVREPSGKVLSILSRLWPSAEEQLQ
jgi:hypothetical protein